ncbi:transporter associated domain-containing protein [Pseudorhodoplanes sp.]|uniref:transporter associated domain-containing protein n=1 Tax=Pseudorhodoplanes sp. TaxID=1934341 RepID=UPI00391A49AF
MPDTERSASSTDPQSTSNLPATTRAAKSRDGGDGVFSRWLRTVFGWRSGSTRADLKEVLEESPPSELGFSPEEGTMLKNILGLRERRIDDVMVPRAHIVAVQQDIALGELVKVFEKAGHSRLVAFNDTLDDPVGMVHIRDLIAFITARASTAPKARPRRRKKLPEGAANKPVAEAAAAKDAEKPVTGMLDLSAVDLTMPLSKTKIIRTMLFVPPSMPAIDLLAKMQATRIHLALVVDEYGGTDGIVSIEDLVELIVGDIEDEHDEEEAPGILRQSDGSFVADARASLEDVIEAVGKGFDVGEALNEVDTLAGYLVSQVGRVPVRGELVPGPSGFEFEVLDADPRRVKKVRIHSGKSRRGARELPAPAQPSPAQAVALPAPSQPKPVAPGVSAARNDGPGRGPQQP